MAAFLDFKLYIQDQKAIILKKNVQCVVLYLKFET